MRREIKFRGRAFSNSCTETVDKIVHGDLLQEYNCARILDWYDGDIYYVHPDSVDQLIAADVRGKEVYERDKVVRLAEMYDPDAGYIVTDGKPPQTAGFEHYADIINGEMILAEEVENV